MGIQITVIGVTGPSGAGKSLFCSRFAEAGYRVIDCDAVYHEMISRPSRCVAELSREENFGRGILLPDGSVDRRALSREVFAGTPESEKKLGLLNSITHRHVRTSIKRRLSHPGGNRLGFVIDAPLLFQAGVEADCCLTVAVLASGKIRLERLRERDGLPDSDLLARLGAAPPDEWYSGLADVTVVNDGSPEKLFSAADAIMEMTGEGRTPEEIRKAVSR